MCPITKISRLSFGDVMSTNRDEFDFSAMGDRVALASDWNSMLFGLAPTISTQKLYKRRVIKTMSSKLELRPTKRVVLLYVSIFLVGFVHLCALIFNFPWFTVQGMLLFAIVPIGIAAFSVLVGMQPIVFDKQQDIFWKSWLPPAKDSRVQISRRQSRLGDIYAIQLIYTYLRVSTSRRVPLYELNLVFKDASRVHLVAHGHRQKIRESAETLSLFLGKPVWDAIDYFESRFHP